MTYFVMFMLFTTALFLILLVLVQRGKGGGLAGAFGGAGGQSAFGTKAGDLFTKITIGVAAFWIVLCMLAVYSLRGGSAGPLSTELGSDAKAGVVAPAEPITEEPAEEGAAPVSE